MSNNISPFISEQFPSLYREDGTFFVDFVTHYYKWMESTGNTLYHTRRLPEYIDIDTTAEDFIIHFKEKYLPNFALLNETDKRTLVKHCLDIYRSKGSIRSIKLLFKLVYDDDVEVYWPGDDILKPSAGTFKKPRYLELSVASKTSTFVGKEVIGDQSGARAIVESVSRRNINEAIIDIAQLTNVRGNFVYGELVTTDGVFENAPRVVGSLTDLTVISGGRGFSIGQILDITSAGVGYAGQAKVKSTIKQSGQVAYTLTDGGSGYSDTANVYISERVLGFNNLRPYGTFYASQTNFIELETISQPLVNASFTSATGVFPVGGYVYGVDGSSGYATVAVGVVANTTQTVGSYSVGTITVSDRKANHITLDTITNADPATSSFGVGDTVYQRAYSGVTSNTGVGHVYGANSTTIAVEVTYGTFSANVMLYSADHATAANAYSVTTYNQRFTNTSISDFRLANTTNALLNLAVFNGQSSGKVDRTATGSYIGSNSTHLGILNISPTAAFINTPQASIKGLTSNVYANVTSISSGNPGSFQVATLSDTETVYLGTDELNANNLSSVPFVNIALNATAYGFPKNGTANSSSLLINALTFSPFDIGTIATIGSIDPGSDNTIDPIVLIRDKKTAGYLRRNYEIGITDKNEFSFVVGDTLTQAYGEPVVTATFTSLTGNTQFDTSGLGESAKQVRSDGITVYGTVQGQSVAGATKTVSLTHIVASNSIGAAVSATFNTSNAIVGLISSANASSISVVESSTIPSVTVGTISYANSTAIGVDRTRFANPTVTPTVVSDTATGASATVSSYSPIVDSRSLGDNANVLTSAGGANGVVTEVEIVSSGFAYAPNESVTLTDPTGNNQYVVTASASVTNEGKAAGYWESTDSFLSSDKKIQDSEYYQEFSYEIQSSLSRQTYERKILDTVHVAGTKMFGAVVSRQEVPAPITTLTTNTEYNIAVAATTGFNVGDTVIGQYGSQANTTGTVIDVVTRQSTSFNASSDVTSGSYLTFNASSAVANGAAATFNANSSVNEGQPATFNANTSVIESVNFTFNSNSAVTSAVEFSINANTNVIPGAALSFSRSDALGVNAITLNASSVTPGLAVTFNANSDVSSIDNTIAISTANSFSVNDAIKYTVSAGNTALVGLTNNQTYYVQLANDTHIALSSTPGSARLTLTKGLTQTGHTLTGASVLKLTNANVAIGDAIQYLVAAGNTALANLTSGTTYYVNTVNSSSVGLSATLGGTQIVLKRGLNQTGHTLIPVDGKNVIKVSSISSSLGVGNAVLYYTDNNRTTIGGLSNNTTYYIESVNVSTISLASTFGGTRIPLDAGTPNTFNNDGHHLLLVGTNSTINTSDATKFTTGDQILYRTQSGNTPIVPLSSNAVYYVNFANATHFAIAANTTGPRLALSKGLTETGHVFMKTEGASAIIATSYAANLVAGDTVTYNVSTGNTALTNLTSGSSYYVQFANATHIALTSTKDGVRIPLYKGLTQTGHRLTAGGQKSTIITTAAKYYQSNDAVKYVTAAGNTVLSGFTNGSTYYVQFANDTHIALSSTAGGSRIQLTKGATESGHAFSPKDTHATIAATNSFTAGDQVEYTAMTGNTALINFADAATYFIESANATHFALSSTSGGYRIGLTKGYTETGHALSSTGANGVIASANAQYFAANDEVLYTTNSGNTTLSGLSNNTVYYVQFANATHLALTSSIGGYRIPVKKGASESGHKITRTGDHSTIRISNHFSVGEPVYYVVASGNTAVGGLSGSTLYYVQQANQTHISLSSTSGGERITLTAGSNETGHRITDASINTVAVVVTSTPGEDVAFVPTGTITSTNTSTQQTIVSVDIST